VQGPIGHHRGGWTGLVYRIRALAPLLDAPVTTGAVLPTIAATSCPGLMATTAGRSNSSLGGPGMCPHAMAPQCAKAVTSQISGHQRNIRAPNPQIRVQQAYKCFLHV
jgi:hypothetical protein